MLQTVGVRFFSPFSERFFPSIRQENVLHACSELTSEALRIPNRLVRNAHWPLFWGAENTHQRLLWHWLEKDPPVYSFWGLSFGMACDAVWLEFALTFDLICYDLRHSHTGLFPPFCICRWGETNLVSVFISIFRGENMLSLQDRLPKSLGFVALHGQAKRTFREEKRFSVATRRLSHVQPFFFAFEFSVAASLQQKMCNNNEEPGTTFF